MGSTMTGGFFLPVVSMCVSHGRFAERSTLRRCDVDLNIPRGADIEAANAAGGCGAALWDARVAGIHAGQAGACDGMIEVGKG